MVKFNTMRGVQPHFILDNYVYYTTGNKFYRSQGDNFHERDLLGGVKSNVILEAISRFDLPKRLLRIGFHSIVKFGTGYLGTQNKAIVWLDGDTKKFRTVFHGYRGSRPLSLCVDPVHNQVYFGEYFGNNARDEVKIYGSTDGLDWKTVWCFKAGEVRHVHGIQYDKFRKGLWVLTGDSDGESGLWFSCDNFTTLRKVVSGSQRFRAVEIICTNEGVVIPMDSPLEKNYIQFLSLPDCNLKILQELPGSAFHATYQNSIYLISTVTEPSQVNKAEYASIWASLDGVKWREIGRIYRDLVPVKYQWLTRYTEVLFAHNEQTSEYIYAYCRAGKNVSNCLIRWKTSDILDYISNA